MEETPKSSQSDTGNKSRSRGKPSKRRHDPPSSVEGDKGVSSGNKSTIKKHGAKNDQRGRTNKHNTRDKEMEKDAEYRRLNAKIKEQEYRMKQLEESSKAEADMTARLAQKVEEEVMQKLSRAAIMSRMYKSSVASNKSQELDKESTRRVEKTQSNRGVTDVNTQSPSTILAQSRPEKGDGKPRDCTRGLLKVQPPRIHQSAQSISDVRNITPVSDPDFQAESVENESTNSYRLNRRQMTVLERDIFQILDEIRRNKPLLQDFCLLGPSNGAPELTRKALELEDMYLQELRGEGVGTAAQAVDEGVPQRIWDVRQKQLQLFSSVLSSANKAGRADKDAKVLQIRNVFEAELTKASESLSTGLDLLKVMMADFAVHQPEDESVRDNDVNSQRLTRQIRSSMHSLLVGMGDIKRYEVSNRSGSGQMSWSAAIDFYKHAAHVAPFEGSVYRSLASLARSVGDIFTAAYYLSRGMVAEISYPPAREAMLEIFESQRSTADSFGTVTALSGLSISEHVERFRCHFLAASGIAYSRAGVDRFPFHMEKCRRHMSTMLQLLSVETIQKNGSGRGSKGDFQHYDQKAFENGSRVSLCVSDEQLQVRREQLRLPHSLDEDICKAMMIVLSLLTSVSEKHHLYDLYHSISWSECYGDIDPSQLSVEEKLAYEKRYNAQSIHKIQSIPGLVDLSRLLLGLVGTLISSEGVGVGGIAALSESDSAATRLVATCRCVSIFLEWLSSHPEYQVLSIIDKSAWEQMEGELPAYLSALPACNSNIKLQLTRSDDSPSDLKFESDDIMIHPFKCMVEEDHSLIGFRPLENIYSRRLKEFSRLCRDIGTYEETASHSIPYYDPMWIIVCASRCSTIARELCTKPLILGGEDGIRFQSNRLPVLPSADFASVTGVDGKKLLTVIVYKSSQTARSAGYCSSGVQRNKKSVVLNEDEFLRGLLLNQRESVASVEDQTRDHDDHDQQCGSNCSTSLNSVAISLEPQEKNDVNEDHSDVHMDGNALSDDPPSARDLLAARCAALLKGKGKPYPESVALESDHDDVSVKEPITDDATNRKQSTLDSEESKEKGALKYPGAVSGGLIRVADKTALNPPAVTPVHPPRKPNKKKNYPSAYGPPTAKAKDGELPLIVIDAPNVAMRHGINAKFSCRGIKLALDFFHAAGHRVIAFLPDHYLNFERVGELRRLANLKIGDVRAAQIPDDVHVLQQLVAQGFVVGTPSQDYDDSYCINYAKQRGGYIISNDMYRDHVKRIEQPALRNQVRDWIKSHVISYTFVGDEFLPNPDASIFVH
mmetsp:Transcript_3015/g.4597  ORF Transcript_3015/g.4597 Transcript_3015/m.4597 type:complete len:1289 (-) Transcript_3015:431-4297(-)|eukprot:CAMPEP_0185022392 /NCGR_PEP_ID=MMETSP1103-20130426/5114_1 /TAXON_ID=36769 /ORGANISM="Paraphysomonas bandaiensis, Strain Caron Lab Isolate" /LENGTH=1288 /DNA_ID=CAMNT_0027554449 /DNA_START=124 /DNA_END=3990 /DNA_ORIENTATION=+